MEMQSPVMTRSLAVLLVVNLGCTRDAIGKDEAAAMNGRGPDGEDLCEENAWYGDGECDDFCVLPDSDCASMDAGMRDAGMRDGGMSDGGMSDAGADAGRIDGGMEPGTDAGMDDGGMHDAGMTDGGAPAMCGAGLDAGSLSGVQPLPTGLSVDCHGAWDGQVLRGPGSWQRMNISSINQLWPVELDPGQTLVVRSTVVPGSGSSQAWLFGGPCKLGGGTSLTSYTASGHENFYLRINGSLVSHLEVEISGPAAAPFCAACDTSGAIDVSRDTPFAFGTFGLPSETSTEPFPLTSANVWAPGALSCSGVRHLGSNALFRVHMRAGEHLSANAFNPASMGADPMGAYLVRDCNDLTSCIAGSHGDGASVAYDAVVDETVYVVFDLFANDYAPTYVRVTVTGP
jgi:hypothetical protein